MINKILIRTSDRKTLHKDRRSLGMNGENLQEVLLFCLDEKIEGIGIVEVELPDGTKGMIEVDRTEEGYELPVKSSLLTQTGFVKFQLRILHDDVEIFKSEIIALEVKDSINATETIPEQYPTWIDNLTTLKQELEKAESERVSNENERQSAEKTRQENFTKMQETVSSAVSNIKDLTEEYNSNAGKETKKFNDNAVEQTKTFNDNSDSKLAEYNKNHTDKIKEYDDNGKAKLDEYNENDADKTNAYNDNTVLKEKAFNDIVTESTEVFNTNVEQKETEFEDLAEEKINEYNQVSAELTAKVKQVQAENESLKAENKLIKEQIPSATASGNNIHIEDSGSLDFEWKINGGHKQATREGYNLLDLTSLIGKTETKNGVTYKINEDCSITVNGKPTEYTSFRLLDISLKAGTYKFVDGLNSNDVFLQTLGDFPNTSQNRTISLVEDGSSSLYLVISAAASTLDNVTVYPMIYEGTEDKEYEQYGASPSPDYPSEVETVNSSVKIDVINNDNTKSQTAIMPIQQEMLTGDYVADVEHHRWKKLMLTGNENWIKGYNDGSERENLGFRVNLEELKQIDKTQNSVLCGALCNYLKESLFFVNDISKEVWGNLNTFALSMSIQYILALNIENINTVEELKSFLNSKYEAGTPVTIYYKLATPVDLELTEEQKAVREQKLYTYKNITNIAVSDELASIDVEYQKNPTTEHDDLQNQIDEIKQLLSTTQTSALLLDNLQKDVESEVE